MTRREKVLLKNPLALFTRHPFLNPTVVGPIHVNEIMQMKQTKLYKSHLSF